MTKEQIMICIVLPLSVALGSALIIGIFTAIKKLIQKKYGKENRLIFKEIKRTYDKDIDSFVELYNTRIPEELRICSEQIICFIDTDPTDNIAHHLYICKHNNKVVGFIKIMVSIKNDYLFIAYIASDKTDDLARENAVPFLLDNILKKHLSGKKKVTQIFTEIERGANNNFTTALSKNIARKVSMYKMNAYVLEFDYVQPKMPDDKFSNEHEGVLSLVWIPNFSPEKDYLPSKRVLEICKSLYKDIYWPSCEGGEKCKDYLQYINELIANYKNTLPRKIKIIKL